MNRSTRNTSFIRSRWAAIGAAVAVSLGAGGVGWIAHAANSTPSTFIAITPCRLFDTRPAPDNVGDRATPLNAGEEFVRPVWGTNGDCTIPSGATAISYNLTVPTSIDGYLTLYPADTSRPNSSSINPVAGEPVKANAGVVGLSAAGAIKVFTLTGPVDAVLDITGYYKSGSQAPWDVIPSGQTVTGTATIDTHQGTGTGADSVSIDLPGVTPVALVNTTVNLGADGGAMNDLDPECSGTWQAPTAPPGKVCIYVGFAVGVDLTTIRGTPGYLQTRSFILSVRPSGSDNDDEVVNTTWAYTAP